METVNTVVHRDGAIPRRCRALVMAGGRSERMRASAGIHKAFATVHGRRLIDRNLDALFQHGFLDIAVAVGSHTPEIEADLTTGPAHALLAAAGASLEIIRETEPLGTIGAARLAIADADALLVVNVDNLTTLPLRAMVEHHWATQSDFTIASHAEPFRMPFGQLVIHDGAITEYREKPVIPVQVSSGLYVLGRQTAALIAPRTRVDIPALFDDAVRHRLSVRAFVHEDTWIDVNDAGDRSRAEHLFAE